MFDILSKAAHPKTTLTIFSFNPIALVLVLVRCDESLIVSDGTSLATIIMARFVKIGEIFPGSWVGFGFGVLTMPKMS